ncbi:mammalian cell entry protein [Prescottella defluvii]|uniref:mammalian cell entry protein n=1 Tax=Prescottella defluvii TaxID=1323361 RepID=UPI000ABDD49B|nr:mammalian cell entry protein [Prescottella defluvii]
MTDTTTTAPTKNITLAAVAVGVLLVGALVAAVFFGIGWARAESGRSTADARDTALSDARQAAINLNSYDAADMEKSFADLESSITGSLLDDLGKTREDMTAAAAASGAKTDGRVLRAALTSLNVDDGTADAMLVVETSTVMPNLETPVKRQITMRMSLVRDGDVWKASDAGNLGEPVVIDPGTPRPAAPAPAPEGQATDPQSGGQ